MQGFVGYLPTKESIFVVFRGSTSIGDWLNNLDALLTDYPLCRDCRVHKGFYLAQQSAMSLVRSAVQTLKQQFPSYRVVVTGHSLGAALATLTALQLHAEGPEETVRLFHFGSPRVGNTAFATFASKTLADRSRLTHHKDMVPHCPMHERCVNVYVHLCMDVCVCVYACVDICMYMLSVCVCEYMHMTNPHPALLLPHPSRFTHHSGEWYEDASGLRQCEGLEDSSCSYQWSLTNVDDHMHYLGLYMACSAV
ncbi:lipase family protein [archaeon]|nr:MAG: lipase family protein [archaeon]